MQTKLPCLDLCQNKRQGWYRETSLGLQVVFWFIVPRRCFFCVLFVCFCLCHTAMPLFCSPCGHLLAKDWLLGLLVCNVFLVCHFPIWGHRVLLIIQVFVSINSDSYVIFCELLKNKTIQSTTFSVLSCMQSITQRSWKNSSLMPVEHIQQFSVEKVIHQRWK